MKKITFDEIDEVLERSEISQITGGCGNSYGFASSFTNGAGGTPMLYSHGGDGGGNGGGFGGGSGGGASFSAWKSSMYGTAGSSSGNSAGSNPNGTPFSFSPIKSDCPSCNTNTNTDIYLKNTADLLKNYYAYDPGTYYNKNSIDNPTNSNSYENGGYSNGGSSSGGGYTSGGGGGGSSTSGGGTPSSSTPIPPKIDTPQFDEWYYATTKGTGGSGSGIPVLKPKDGIDFKNPNTKISFDSSLDKYQQNQLKDILSKNSIMKSLVSTFLDGDDNTITFKVGEETGGLIHTDTKTGNYKDKNIEITIDKKLIDKEQGIFIYDIGGKDNMGYDRQPIPRGEEELVIDITHELIHAKILADIANAINKSDQSPKGIIEMCKKDGIPDSIVNAYFKQTPIDPKNPSLGYNLEINPDKDKLIHKYLEENYTKTIDNALEEYRKD